MASVTKYIGKDGETELWKLQFTTGGIRRTLYLGCVLEFQAREIKDHVEHLLRSVSLYTELRYETQEWLNGIPSEFWRKMVNCGLLPGISVTVVEFGDRKHYQMQWRDPATGKKRTRSTGVLRGQKSRADQIARDLQTQLNASLRRDDGKVDHSLLKGKNGIVYFVEDVETGLIKIGFTTRSVERRIADFDGQSPVNREYKVLALMNAQKEKEHQLHRQFSEERISRKKEWFRPSQSLTSYIKRVLSSGC